MAIEVTYEARLTVRAMKPAVRDLFLRLWREAVARHEAHASEGCKPLAGERGSREHEELADYVARLAGGIEAGESPKFAIAWTRVPALSAYTHTPTVQDLEKLS